MSRGIFQYNEDIINDANNSTRTTYSSKKINDLLSQCSGIEYLDPLPTDPATMDKGKLYISSEGYAYTPDNVELINQGNIVFKEYKQNALYKTNEVVYLDVSLARVLQDFTSDNTQATIKESFELDITNNNLIKFEVQSKLLLKGFQPNFYYEENEMIVEDGNIYTRIDTGTSGSNFGADLSHWKLQTQLRGTNSGRYVKFNYNVDSFNNTANVWYNVKNYKYIDGDSSLLDTANGIFTAPVSGLYYFNFCPFVADSNIDNSIFAIHKNSIMISSSIGSNLYKTQVSNIGIIHLDAGDILQLKMYSKTVVSIDTSYAIADSEFGLLTPDESDLLVASALYNKPTSSPANASFSIVKYTNSTNTSVINSNGTITLPADGVYYLHADGLGSTSGGQIGFINTKVVRTASTDSTLPTIFGGQISGAVNNQYCTVDTIIYGNKGETFSIQWQKTNTTAQTNLVYNTNQDNQGIQLYKLKGSEIRLTPKDFYDQYVKDATASNSTIMTYDEWVSMQINQTAYRVVAKSTNIAPDSKSKEIDDLTYVSGDESMIDATRLVAPVSGVYYLRALPIRAEMLQEPARFSVYRNNTDDIVTTTSSSSEASKCMAGVLNATIYLEKGDELIFRVYNPASTNTATASINPIEFGLINPARDLINRPDKWVVNQEYDFGDNLYGRRVQGDIRII